MEVIAAIGILSVMALILLVPIQIRIKWLRDRANKIKVGDVFILDAKKR